jgi:hypothetical protein
MMSTVGARVEMGARYLRCLSWLTRGATGAAGLFGTRQKTRESQPRTFAAAHKVST